MIPYLFVFAIISIFSLTHFSKELKNYNLIFYIFSSVLLIFFAGLRKNGVGADDISYYNFFLERTPNLYDWIIGNYIYDIKEHFMEPGYVLINSVIKVFSNSYITLFSFMSLFSVGIAAYNYKRYSKYVFLTLLLFFVHTYLYRDMNQIRSALAASICLFLITQFHNREHFKIWFTILLASVFHVASLSVLVVYILSFIRVTRKRAFFAYILFCLIGTIGISQIVLSLVPGGDFLNSKIYTYTENKSYANAVSFFDVTNVKNSFVLLFILFFWERLEKKVPYFSTLVLFYLLAVGIRLAFWDLGVISARLSTFFAIVEVILIPYFVTIFRQKILITVVIILYAFMTLYLNLFIKSGRYPYELSVF